MPAANVPIDFHKPPGGRYHSVLHRPDGVSVRLQGGSYNRIGGATGRVPHDIAHLVVEHRVPTSLRPGPRQRASGSFDPVGFPDPPT